MIRLVTYVRVPRDNARRRITRRAVFARDSWTCQYCGTTSHLTVDHMVPRSRGGPSGWDNIVTSCAPCNRRKGNRTPVETGMKLRSKPRAPGPTVFIRVAAPVVPRPGSLFDLGLRSSQLRSSQENSYSVTPQLPTRLTGPVALGRIGLGRVLFHELR